jgi:hypothetical protein
VNPLRLIFAKRNALQNEILRQSNSNIFYIDTFVLDHPREKVLAALQSSRRHWQDMAEQEKHG